MHICVADAIEMGEHRHAGVGLDPRDKALAAARHDHVDQAGCGQHRADDGTVLRRHELDRRRGNADALQPLGHRGLNRAVGMQRLATATQQHGIAGAQAQGRGVGRHVGAAFIDDSDQADRDAYAAELQAVGPLGLLDHLPDGIGQGSDLVHGIGDTCKARRIEPQAIEHRTGQALGFTGCDVERIGFQNWRFRFPQGCSRSAQRLGLLGIAEPGKNALGGATLASNARDKHFGRFGIGRAGDCGLYGHGRELAPKRPRVTDPA
ncbi:hypothetical protein SPHV1_170064 [Novosphingobium sp. KN65.2]|nr:hypothetical protein SPHV1_170064 [Novosphingobium sp. KN65.2]